MECNDLARLMKKKYDELHMHYSNLMMEEVAIHNSLTILVLKNNEQ